MAESILKTTQLTPEGEAAVGRIAIWAAMAERNLVDLIRFLEGTDSATNKKNATLSGSDAVKKNRKLVRDSAVLLPDERNEVCRVLDEVRKLLQERNAVIHAMVGTSARAGAATFRSPRGNPDRTLTVEDLAQLAERINEFAWQVFDCQVLVARAHGRSR
jgi:hypothetical protein